MTDLVVINPGGGNVIYQDLNNELTAIEPPLWARLIAGYCDDMGHSVEILDMNLQAGMADPVMLSAKLICIAAYGHQPSASTQSMKAVEVLVTVSKARYPSTPVIVVGGHAAALPERTLRETGADYVCTGEGPLTVERLLSHLKGECPIYEVSGLLRRDGWTQNPPLMDVSKLHGNVWHKLPMDSYRAHNWQCFDGSPRTPYASIYTSLGCPYKCSFCCINAPFGVNRYRMRTPLDVAKEVWLLHEEYNVSTLKITDEMFVLNRRHYLDICSRLSQFPFADDLNIWAYARIDTVRKEDLPIMRKAGIRWLALGIESGSEHVREGSNKTLNAEDITTIVREIHKAGINVIGNFIFGLPDDTMETMGATLLLARSLNLEFANFYSAMAYPGSGLYNEAEEKDLPKAWSGYSQHSKDTTPLPTATVSSRDVLRFRDEAFNRYFTDPIYIDRIARKFGDHAVQQIEIMTSHELRREI